MKVKLQMKGNPLPLGLGKLCAAALVALMPALVYGVETDRITVEDSSSGEVLFRVTSAGNVTGASLSGDGSGLTNVPHWKGTWSTATAYNKDDCVFYGGSSWIALLQNSNAQPSLNPTFWVVMAQQGPAGAQGTQGAVGPTGAQGPQGPAGSPDTQIQILSKISTQTDGAVLAVRQGPTNDQANTIKFSIKDKSGGIKTVFTADGRLGIGTSSPSVGLHVSGTAVSTGNNDGIAAVVDTTLKAAKVNDVLYGLKIAPIIDLNGFANPLLYSLHLPGATNGIVRMRFDNTSAGTAAQAGIEMNNDAGQSLITFYSSQSSTATLKNLLYVKNSVGAMKFLAAPGSSVGFGVGTTAASANNIFIDPTTNVGIGTSTPTQKLEVNGGVRINTAVDKPTCDDNRRGTLWFTQKGIGAMDALEVCIKDAAEAYEWKAVW